MEDTAFEKEPTQQVYSKNKPPCAVLYYDKALDKQSWAKPAVNCGFECDRCGWNPAVKKKRVEKMLAELEARSSRKAAATEKPARGRRKVK